MDFIRRFVLSKSSTTTWRLVLWQKLPKLAVLQKSASLCQAWRSCCRQRFSSRSTSNDGAIGRIWIAMKQLDLWQHWRSWCYRVWQSVMSRSGDCCYEEVVLGCVNVTNPKRTFENGWAIIIFGTRSCLQHMGHNWDEVLCLHLCQDYINYCLQCVWQISCEPF